MPLYFCRYEFATSLAVKALKVANNQEVKRWTIKCRLKPMKINIRIKKQSVNLRRQQEVLRSKSLAVIREVDPGGEDVVASWWTK